MKRSFSCRCCSLALARSARAALSRRGRCASSCRSRPGGFADVPARMLAPRLSERSGASSSSRTSPARAAPSARTSSRKPRRTAIRCVITGTHARHQPRTCTRTLPYDVLKDFTPIAHARLRPVRAGGQSAEAARRRLGARADRAREGAARATSTTPARATAARSTWSARCSTRMAGIELNHVPVQGQRPGDAGPARRAGRRLVRRRAERAVARQGRAGCARWA